MSDEGDIGSWRVALITGVLVFTIASAGTLVAFALWLQDLAAPQVAFLGSGNRLSLLVTDGPARLLLATGDDAIEFENALSRVRPIFARRIDVLLLAGSDSTLLVPEAAHADPHVRTVAALALMPSSSEAEAIGAVSTLPMPRRIRLGPSVNVTVETALPYGADPASTFPAWRATIERGDTRIVMLSDGEAAGLFEPEGPASVLAISGADPLAAWDVDPAVALVANADLLDGPDLRSAFTASPHPPRWGFRVFPGEALRLRFTEDGVEIPSESANDLSGTPADAGMLPQLPEAVMLVRRRVPPSRGRTRP